MKNISAIFLSGLAIAGGYKASIKLMQDVLQIKSQFVADRTNNLMNIPTQPVEASAAAANGDSLSEDLLNSLFEQSGFRGKYSNS